MKIVAKEGYVYTRKETIDIKNRTFAKVIYLGNEDSIDNYILITEEEMDRYILENRLDNTLL